MPRADVGGPDLDPVPAIHKRPDKCAGGAWAGIDRVSGGGDAGPGQPAVYEPGSWHRIPVLPPKPAYSLAQAGGEVTGGVGQAGFRIDLRFVAEPQFDRVNAADGCELIHGRFQCEHPGRFASCS